MEKIKMLICLFLITMPITVNASISEFNFDSSKLSFSKNNSKDNVINSFNKDYIMSTNKTNENTELNDKIKLLTKKVTYLLLGNMNSNSESSEEYYKRHNDYLSMAAYNFFPKDKTTKSGYDETIPNYKRVIASEFIIPQMFISFNKLGIIYNSYGDIRINDSGNIVMSSVVLPNVKLKQENKSNPKKYDYVNTNLIINYHFLKIDNNYRLIYLYGETTDNLNKYFNNLEDDESSSIKGLVSTYNSNISSTYNMDKLNNLTDDQIKSIYNNNLENVVYITANYNNKIVGKANGFFINDGIILTTWDFFENALKNAQYLEISGMTGKTYNSLGIITANPENNVVLIKVKNNGQKVTLDDSSKYTTEDPVITISSKSGLNLIIQKGIIVSNNSYIETTIPLSNSDEGSPLFDSNGNVIGFNTAKLTNSSFSIAMNSTILKEIQNKFNNINYDSIDSVSFDKIKSTYYIKMSNEKTFNNIPANKWKYYSKIGDIKTTINLKIIKASYNNGVVSIRYKNEISDYISGIQLATLFRENLIKEGYKNTLKSDSKYIYENGKYQVILMNEFNYLIVLLVKL